MPRRKKKSEESSEGRLVRFNLLSEGSFAIAKAVIEDVDPLLKRNIMTLMEKKLHSVDSFAKYVLRQLVRDGIYCDYNSNITPLPDGFRLTIEMRLAALDLEIAKRKIKSIYLRAFDLVGDLYKYREIERRIEEETRKRVEVAVIEGSLGGGGDLHQGSVPAGEGSRKEDEEG